MFPRRYFPGGYFAPRFFPQSAAAATGTPPVQYVTGTDSRAASITGTDSRAASITGTDSRAASFTGRYPE